MAVIRKAQYGSGTIDMEYLGTAMMKNPQILQELIVSAYAYLPIQSLFSGVYNESPSEELTPSNMVQWKLLGMPTKPAYIVSATGSFRVGSDDNRITVSDGIFWPGAKLRLEDGRSQVIVTGQRTAAGQTIELSVQVVGNNENDVVDSRWLEPGKALNYLTANYGELSTTGHPMPFGTFDSYVNAMSLHRHKAQISGDALSEALVMEMVKADVATGQNKMLKLFLPNVMHNTGQSLLSFHMESMERDHVFAKANFDFNTGRIFNKGADGRDIVLGDGLLAQLESAYTVLYSPNDQWATISRQIDRVLAYMSYNASQGEDLLDMFVIGGTGARYVWNKVMESKLMAAGQNTVVDVNKQVKTIYGLDVDQYKTNFGSIRFIYSRAFDNPMERTQEVTVDGMKLPAISFDMHLFPVKRLSNGKTNIRIFAKAKTTGGQLVNRSLVFGHIPGMTGMGISAAQKASIEGYNAQMVATGLDAEQWEVLSQKTLIVSNPTQCARLLVMR